jgi:outer membrane protein, multidrug efflux system
MSRGSNRSPMTPPTHLQVGGLATALDVIDAQRTLAADEQSLAQLQSTISEDQIAVFLALGGGWETGS